LTQEKDNDESTDVTKLVQMLSENPDAAKTLMEALKKAEVIS